MNIKIKNLTSKDIHSILELESHSGPDKPLYSRYNKKALQYIFNNTGCNALGAFEGNQLIGWGAYRSKWSKYNKEAGVFEISSIVVDKTKRKKGIGSKILYLILNKIKSAENVKKIYLTVSPLNKVALMLYLKNGFVIFDYKKNLYGPGSDRIFLEFRS